MKMLLVIFFISVFSLSCSQPSSPNTFKFMYGGLNFQLPSGHTAIGVLGSNDDFLLFKYGIRQGKEYLAFSKMLTDDPIQYNCPPSALLNNAFSQQQEKSCNKDELIRFKDIFIASSISVTQAKNGFIIYSAATNESSFLFIVKGESAIKVDSDIYSSEDLYSFLVLK